MLKMYHNENEKEFVLIREYKGHEFTGEEFITPAKIKEVINSIKLLFNNPEVKVFVSGGCFDVKPINKKSLKIDPPIFREEKVININKNSLELELYLDGYKGYEGKHNYKTVKLNEVYYSAYENKKFESNVIEKVTFKY